MQIGFKLIIQNYLFNQNLSEYHTGYRAYRAYVLDSIDYNSLSDDFIIPNLVLESINKDNDLSQTTIICSDVLVYQNIVNDKTRMCDIVNIKYLDFNDTSTKYFLVCREGDISYLKERFGIDLDLSLWYKYKQIFEFTIYSKK